MSSISRRSAKLPCKSFKLLRSFVEDWTNATQPGNPGFNAFATNVMITAGVISAPGDECEVAFAPGTCPPLQPHQATAIFLLHPKSPASRMLIDHPTGSGKTRVMIEVLNNYFHDPRPKVPVFPKEPVCRNFYAELLRWPSRYRDYFCCLRPEAAASASGFSDWRSRREHFWNLSGLGDGETRDM